MDDYARRGAGQGSDGCGVAAGGSAENGDGVVAGVGDKQLILGQRGLARCTRKERCERKNCTHEAYFHLKSLVGLSRRTAGPHGRSRGCRSVHAINDCAYPGDRDRNGIRSRFDSLGKRSLIAALKC